jgi:Ca-activated chloride channel family protein
MSTSSGSDIQKLGMMVLVDPSASPLPLERTLVSTHLTGLIASVGVQQQFRNPFDTPIELEYLFPLPENAAMTDFSLQIGARLVRAEVQETEQAKQAYEQARDEGKHAALLNQRRPNLFAIRIANVLPHEIIQAKLQYEERLTLNPGELEFVFPMGLTPRYQSPLAPREPEAINPAYSLPDQSVGPVEIQLTADLGVAVGLPTSPSHKLKIEAISAGKFSLNLEGTQIPDHDFVLRIPLKGKPVEIAAWCAQDSAGEVLLAHWLPGDNGTEDIQPTPREFVFVLDRSGSMTGEPIQQARNALRACLRILEPQDTFRILLFDDRLEWYHAQKEGKSPDADSVNQASIHQADTFLSQIEGRGGTEIVQALEAILNLPSPGNRMRYVLFLTDGAVSAEEQALSTVRKKLGQTRIFTFGIGSSVNRALLSRMAQLGRGAAEFLQLDEDIEGAILRFQDKVAFPLLTDIHLEWHNCRTWDLYPSLLPDLYAGQTLQLAARIKRDSETRPATLRVSGKRGAQSVRMELNLPAPIPDSPEVTRAWAKARLDDLQEQSASGATPAHQARQEVISLAIEHRMATPFTAFVAIDSEVINQGGKNQPIQVSQPLPKGLDRAGFMPMMPAMLSPQPLYAAPLPPPSPAAVMRTLSAAPDTDASPTSSLLNRVFKKRAQPPQQAAAKESAHQISEEVTPFDTASILRWLARTQELDGSWPDGVEFTAVALLAFARNGHTLRRGYYRKQVGRAAAWLAKSAPQPATLYLQVLALLALVKLDPDPGLQPVITQLAQHLPAPQTAFEQAVSALLDPSLQAPPAPAPIRIIEDVYLAAALDLHSPIPNNLIASDPSGLLKVWAAAVIP